MLDLRATVRLLLVGVLVVGCAGETAVPSTTPGPTNSAPPTAAPTSPAATPTTEVTPSSAPVETPSVAPSATGLSTSAVWRPLSVPNSPTPREDQTWTVDPIAGVAYMFGGRANGEALDELWRYDLATDTWTQLEPPAPRPGARFGHVAAWDEAVGLTIWSGQQDADKFFDDMWIYDGDFNVWQDLPGNGALPPARYGSCGGFAADGFFWMSHGFTMEGGRFYDTRAYDLARGRWFDRTPDGNVPVERCLHDCFFTQTGEMVLYGGQTNGVKALGDLWTYDTTAYTWTRQAEPPAPARQLYALATLNNRAYFFGGGDIDGGYLSDLWQLDIDTLAWTQLTPAGPAPDARSGATLIADPARSRLLLFGGKNDDGEFGDMWELSAAP